MSLWLYFWLLLKGSLFSMSGLGNVPSVHADLTARGWATERQFAEALAVGQVAPGPNGLWVISLGYLTAGGRGAGLALLAITLPPLLVLAVERLYRRVRHHPAVEGFVRGLGLAAVGIFFWVLLGLLRTAGLTPRSLLITLAALGLGATRRVPAIVILALAALAGVIVR
ncbi:MAG: chromate transporter [Armatimonadetes bacterium]|nr:chromate transporter [Armatimonadota bacterium]